MSGLGLAIQIESLDEVLAFASYVQIPHSAGGLTFEGTLQILVIELLSLR
jgi:hypothetical protein